MKFHKPFWLIVPLTVLSLLLGACNLATPPGAEPTADLGAVQTQVFNDILTQAAAQQTQTALAIPPTPMPTETPFPTPTLMELPTFAPVGGADAFATATPFQLATLGFTPLALPTATLVGGVMPTITTKNGCNDGAYIGEVGDVKQDWAVLKGGQYYQQAFTILNTGSCPWDEGYAFTLVTQFSTPGIEWNNQKIIIAKTDEFTQPQHSQSFVVKFKAPKAPGKYEGYWKMQSDGGESFGPMVWIKFTVQ